MQPAGMPPPPGQSPGGAPGIPASFGGGGAGLSPAGQAGVSGPMPPGMPTNMPMPGMQGMPNPMVMFLFFEP